MVPFTELKFIATFWIRQELYDPYQLKRIITFFIKCLPDYLMKKEVICNPKYALDSNLFYLYLFTYIYIFCIPVKFHLEGYNIKNFKYLQNGDTRQDETEDNVRFQAWKACLGRKSFRFILLF